MKNLFNILTLLVVTSFLLGPFAGCKKSDFGDATVALGSDVNIESFSINGTPAVIDEAKSEINIELPFGSDPGSVTPTIVLPEGAEVIPASGTVMNLTSPTIIRVNNGNIFTKYTVRATVQKAIVSFKLNNVAGTINDANRTITVLLPPGTDITAVTPDITLSDGITISPASDTPQDFTNPVVYRVTSSVTGVDYTVTAIVQGSIPYVAFIGTAARRSDITSGDEKAASDWLFSQYNDAEYVSFDDVKNGTVDLAKYKAIWWHFDGGTVLPDVVFNATVVTKLKEYYAGGGNLLLTGYGGLYLPTLGIVPLGKGSNNAYGDTTPNIDPNNSWGMSYVGKESHPLFQGLEEIPGQPGNAYLLGKGTWRLNHTAWWKVNEWGGYGDAAGWRAATGGIDLASSDGQSTDVTIGIAEFPSTSLHGRTIVIALGAYDWFNEPNPADGSPSAANVYKPNVVRLTKNAVDYLID